jgi:kinesin family protein 4/21/27
MKERTRILVVVRVRPILPREQSQGQENTRLEVQTPHVKLALDSIRSKKFRFDMTFDENSTQEQVFQECKVPEMITKVSEGFNATIFAYGQTGSGKTHTMEGYEYQGPRAVVAGDGGIIPRAVRQLFAHLEGTAFSISVSALQIYRERVYDLLNPNSFNKSGLKLRWLSGGFYVEELTEQEVSSADAALKVYHAGLQHKIMAAHNLNANSSRSHCLFTFTVTRQEGDVITTGRLQLVDLAGSERIALTGNVGEGLQESININKSLFTLRQVITSLANPKEVGFVPFRDSKLTSLLKQSLGGNCFCLMIACVAPVDSFFDENLSTLTYATKTSYISNEPVKNVDGKTAQVAELKVTCMQKEVKRLRIELANAHRQINILTDVVAQEPPVQDIEKQLKKLESPWAGQQAPPQPQGFDRSFEGFFLSPELLSEKLYDSVKMLRVLMDNNRKLQETLATVTAERDLLDREVGSV